ncbi:MAG: capsule assembly Wzi family protein [Chitinophagaceae bacterium]
MQFKQTPVSRPSFVSRFLFSKQAGLAAIVLLPMLVAAQTTYLPQGDKQNILLERLEIKAQGDSILNFSKTRPFSRGKYVINGVREYLELHGSDGMSKADQYNINSVFRNNTEYLTDGEREAYGSKKPIWKSFYRTPANLYEVHIPDFDLIINPVVQFVVSNEKDNSQDLFLNTRGLTLRGRIANKIGFSAYLTDNQERDPLYVQQWIADRDAVPGAGFNKPFKAAGGVDYFDARGVLTFNVTKYIDVAFGYDRNFIGNGHRSLFLSDFGNSNLFLKLNTRIWKINYQNLFMELHNTNRIAGDELIGKKYAAMHHLDVNVTRWLNIGLFEGVIFGRPNRFDFSYLVPVIFYRSIEQQNGSADNALAGMDFKANVAKKFQFYGQLLLDEFKLSEIKAGNGWWGNKYGIQAGVKYIDAFGIQNLDLQLEHNRVRPFTYSHYDSIANYTHYNQPLAHPLMANFKEWIGIARYQPAPKWLVTAKAMYYRQGRDSSAVSYGSNIFLPNVAPYRTSEYGFDIGSGWQTDVFYSSLLVSYELRQNLFLELYGVLRKQETKTPPITSATTTQVSVGVRWNMHRREFEF